MFHRKKKAGKNQLQKNREKEEEYFSRRPAETGLSELAAAGNHFS